MLQRSCCHSRKSTWIQFFFLTSPSRAILIIVLSLTCHVGRNGKWIYVYSNLLWCLICLGNRNIWHYQFWQMAVNYDIFHFAYYSCLFLSTIYTHKESNLIHWIELCPLNLSRNKLIVSTSLLWSWARKKLSLIFIFTAATKYLYSCNPTSAHRRLRVFKYIFLWHFVLITYHPVTITLSRIGLSTTTPGFTESVTKPPKIDCP